MINLYDENATKLHNDYFNNPLTDNSSAETTDEKILGLNANHMMRCEPSDDLNNPVVRLEIERSRKLNAWADHRGYTYHPILEVWINDMHELKTQEDFEKEVAIFQSPGKSSTIDDFLFTDDFPSTNNSVSTTSTTTTSCVESVMRTHLPISTLPRINDEMEELEKTIRGFEFDPISGNWINDYGIALSPEELSFNIEENRNQEKLAANLSIDQFAKETFRINEERKENEARLAKEMAAGLRCSFAYPKTEFLPVSVKLETLDLYHQQIKAKYHTDASSLIDAGKLCGYVYRSQMDYWEHYKSGKILDSDQLLKKFWIKGKTQLKKSGEF